MKNNKKIFLVIIISFLCILIGSPFINAERHTETLAPNTYWALGTNLQAGDTVNFEIKSESTFINVYIMDEGQMNYYLNDPQDEASWYTGREYWHYFVITSSFVAQYSQKYYVVMINPSDSTSTYVVIDLTIDEYIQKTITITNPTSIDTLDVGDVYITWTSTGDIDYVKIELYKSGVFLETITSCIDNDGSYDWYIYVYNDYTDGSNYQIKITDYDDDSIYDYSDYFSIEESDPYDPYDPYNPNYFWNLLWIIFILTGIGIFVAVILIRRHKKKTPKEVIVVQEREVSKTIYCPECGAEVDKEKIYCSQCGSKIIK